MKKHLLYSFHLFCILIFSNSLQAHFVDRAGLIVEKEVSNYLVCPSPSVLSLVSVGKDSAVIIWNTGGATSWQINWGPVGFVPGTSAQNTLSNPYTVTGLDSLTCYDVYVRDSCAPGDVSAWIGPLTLCTEGCASSCSYTIEMRDQIGGWDGSQLFVLIDSTTTLTYTLTGSRTFANESFAVCDGARLDISWIKHANADDNSVSFDIKDSSGQIIFSQGAYPNSDLFSLVSNCSPTTCFQPNTLGVILTTSNTAVVNWASGGATNWQVQVRKCGDTITNIPMINSSIASTSISGLESGTCYEFYVRDSCGVGDVSIWSALMYFTTTCDTIYQAPYFEDFDASNWIPEVGFDYENSLIDACWDRTTKPLHDFTWVPRRGFDSWISGVVPAFDKNNGLFGNYIYLNDGGNAGDSAFFVSPQIDLSFLNSPELHFWYHRYASPSSILEVEVSNDEGLTWVGKDTITGKTHNTVNTPWAEATVDLSQFINDTIQIRFKAVATSNACCNNQSIDNIFIVESCPPPTMVTTDSVGSSEAYVSWVSSSSDYIIEWGLTGFTQGMGAIVKSNSTNNQHAFTGLQPNTCYEFYLRDSCVSSSKSVWVGPFTFCTIQCVVPKVVFSVVPPLPSPGQTTFSFDASLTTDYDSLYWDYGDGNVNPNGLPFETHTYTSASNGGVVVILTACKKCTDGIDSCKTTSRSILINGIGTEELSLGQNIEIYPNPHNGQVSISLKAIYENIEITVFNFMGQVVLNENYTDTDNVDFNINGSPGIYTIEVKNSKGEFYILKSIKQ